MNKTIDIPSRLIIKILALIGLFIAALWFIVAVHVVLIWLLTAAVLALAINPLVTWMVRKAPWLHRGGAVAIVFVFLLIIVALFAYALVPPLVGETGQLIKQWPQYTNQFIRSPLGQLAQQYHLVDHIRSSQNQLLNAATSAGGSVVSVAQHIFASFLTGLTIVVFTVFMLMEGPYWSRLFFKLMPPNEKHDHHELVTKMYQAVASYMGAKLLLSLIAAVATFIILEILHIPYALSLALIIAIFDLIPLVGVLIGSVVVIIVALFTSVWAAVIVAIFFLIFQQFEDHVTQPMIMKRSMQLTSLTVLVAVLIGAELAGILGALLAIPAAACIHIFIREYLKDRLAA